jgi:hypothetical protein
VNPVHVPRLPASFYEHSDILRKVQQAGFNRITSPDAVLACLLCRVSASLEPGIALPNQGSLNFITALIGGSGTGKSEAFKASRALLPDIGTRVDGWGVGSGQGIVATIAGKADNNGECPVVNPRVLFFADEGEQMLKLGKTEGSILLSILRTAWSGGALGQTNATKELSRNVAANVYRLGLTIGLQPRFASELLTGVHAGDPQRYLFAHVQHPEQPSVLPRFPQPLAPLYQPAGTELELQVDPEVTRLIADYRIKKQRGEVNDDPLDSHRHLLTLKTAGLLSLLHNEDISIHWWNMASQVVEVSRNVRQWVIDYALQDEQSTIIRKAVTEVSLQIQKDELRERDYMNSMIRSMVNKLKDYGIPANYSVLNQACSGKHKHIVPVDRAISEAIQRGLIVQANEGQYALPR